MVILPSTILGSLEFDLETTEILFKNPSDALYDLTLIELSIKCTNLYTEDRFQLLNPTANILIKENNIYKLKGITETSPSTLNPIFQKSFRLSYKLKTDSGLKIEIYDNKAEKSFIGSCITSLHEIISKPNALSIDLTNQNKRCGTVHITANEMNFLNNFITIQ